MFKESERETERNIHALVLGHVHKSQACSVVLLECGLQGRIT